MLALFLGGARIAAGVLELDGVRRPSSPSGSDAARGLRRSALRERARMFQRAAPGALVVYGTKAFPNVELMRLLAEEGIGADVSTLGELAFARRAGIDGEALLVHGNNKSDEELDAAAAAGALVVLDALDEPGRAAAAGVQRVLVRVTPGVEAETHEAIRTGHRGSKFGLDEDDAVEAVRTSLDAGLAVEAARARRLAALRRPVAPAGGRTAGAVRRPLPARARLAPAGDRHRRRLRDPPRRCGARAAGGGARANGCGRSRAGLGAARARGAAADRRAGPRPCRADGVHLYRVGAVKRAGDRRYVAIDGGMSDNPRPQLYQAQYAALLANRADAEPDGVFTIAGKHCESGDVLIERAELPEPARGDLIAVPATGAYTLGMASNYNGVPRPAAVLVGRGEARLIRRRETIDDLLGQEV